VPAAAVIPAPEVYANIAAVKTLVVECRVTGVCRPFRSCFGRSFGGPVTPASVGALV
jgi:hypothetical protein